MIVFSAKEVPIVLMFNVILLSCIWTHSDAGVYNRWSLSRIKRQQSCRYGTYEHEGNNCCYCAAGQYRKKHCTASEDTVCETCSSGSYNLQPDSKPSCEPCMSCTLVNAGREVKENCTIYKNTVCQCRPGHYCRTGEPCFVSGGSCNPCDDCGGKENIKVQCSSTNNAVCKDKMVDPTPTPQGEWNVAAVIVPIVILLLAGLAIGVLFYKREKVCLYVCPSEEEKKKNEDKGGATPLPDDEGIPLVIPKQPDEMQLLNGVNLSCHLQNIAEEVGWTAMRELALGSGTTLAVIDSHVQNHPNDAVERTFQLLAQWVEKQGSDAPETLVRKLKDCGHKGKAEKVLEIIRRNNQAEGRGAANVMD